jgi:CHASE3 domain sensor protein
VQSAEAGQRGYLLTGRRDIYLGPYRVAVEQLPRMLDRTRDLLSDSPQQMQSLAQLQA